MAMPSYRDDPEEDELPVANVIQISPELLQQILANVEDDEPDLALDEQEPPFPPEPEWVGRHPLMNLDFWFLLAVFFCLLRALVAPISLIMIENVVLPALILNVFAIIFNLTRDRLPLMIIKRPIVLKVGRFWPDFGHKKPAIPLRDLQIAHGIKPVDNA